MLIVTRGCSDTQILVCSAFHCYNRLKPSSVQLLPIVCKMISFDIKTICFFWETIQMSYSNVDTLLSRPLVCCELTNTFYGPPKQKFHHFQITNCSDIQFCVVIFRFGHSWRISNSHEVCCFLLLCKVISVWVEKVTLHFLHFMVWQFLLWLLRLSLFLNF